MPDKDQLTDSAPEGERARKQTAEPGRTPGQPEGPRDPGGEQRKQTAEPGRTPGRAKG